MKMLDKLLNQLKLRGLSVEWQSDTTLVLSGPTEERTPAVMAALKQFKGELLQRLRPGGPEYHDVHHAEPVQTVPPQAAELKNQSDCTLCKAFVWDHEETAGMCDQNGCPSKSVRINHG